MFYVLSLIPVAAVVGLAALASHARLGLKGLAFHPFNLLGFFISITLLDFVAAYHATLAGETLRLAGFTEASSKNVTSGLAFFCLSTLAILLGVFLAVQGRRREQSSPGGREGATAAYVMFSLALVVAVYVAAVVLITALSRGSMLYIAGIRAIFFRDNQLLFVLYSMLLPAFFLFGAHERRWARLAAAALVSVGLLLPIGSRGSVIMILLAVAFWISVRVRLPLVGLYVLAPIVGFGLVWYRWAAREAERYGSLSQFLDAHGGVSGALFNTPDIALAEAITINVVQSPLSRAPWESLLGAVMVPIPRSIVPWKPLGASTEFTQVGDLARWMQIRGEWTISGLANLKVEFGYVGAFIVLVGLVWGWARTLLNAEDIPDRINFVGPVMIYFSYVFYRADLYNLALAMWPTALVYIGYRLNRRILRGGARAHN